ncbi:MAG: division/cell wall cluster transcriptional repressor MraZ [Candidatus Aureabacteria bacterium]|nr:division/cell wall cluster transcriptional repressor MraZ [Candidatus Auribacterota bacterium]
MFVGTYQHTVDDKGRLFIPARFRAQENQRFFIAQGLDKCLFVFPEDEWEKWQARIRDLNPMRADGRAFNRMFFSGAAEAISDRQGRINLPQALIDFAGLGKEVMVIGVADRFEIWAVESWRKYQEESTRRYEEIAEKLVE